MKISRFLVPLLSLVACSEAETSEEMASHDSLTAVAITEGDYVFQSSLSGKCLDVAGNSTADDARIVQWTCNGTAAQLFRVTKTDGGYYRIANKASSKALGGASVGQPLGQSDWAGRPAQQWAFAAGTNGAYAIHLRSTDDVFDVRSGNKADGAVVQTWAENGTLAQGWQLVLKAKAEASAGANDDVGAGSLPAGAGSPVAGSGSLSYLHTDGAGIRNAENQAVNLRGVNLGGWLVTEDWMCGITDTSDTSGGQRFARETLEKRFTASQVSTLFKAWEDGWLMTADLDRLKALGFNFLRVPFGYRTLQDAGGNWLRTASGAIDFSRLDWIVNEAGKRGMYVLLDFHIWRGQKENYSLISEANPSASATTRAAADAQRREAASILTNLAAHFKGNGNVAGIDLLNEMTGSYANLAQDVLYKAVRAGDPARIAYIESTYVNPASMKWSNVVYSPHHYNYKGALLANNQKAFQDNLASLTRSTSGYKVPIYIGEFSIIDGDNASSSWTYVLDQYNGQGWSWSPWTYKGVDNGGWALVNYDASVRVDVLRDSYDAILAKWKKLPTAKLNPNTSLQSLVSSAAKKP